MHNIVFILLLLVLAGVGYSMTQNEEDKNVILVAGVAILIIHLFKQNSYKEGLSDSVKLDQESKLVKGKCVVNKDEFNRWYDDKLTNESKNGGGKYYGCCKQGYLGCKPSKIDSELSKEDKVVADREIDLCENKKCMEYNEYKNMCGQLDNDEGCNEEGVSLEDVGKKEYPNVCEWNDDYKEPQGKECTIGNYSDDKLESQPQEF
jgi:hypothetical protein